MPPHDMPHLRAQHDAISSRCPGTFPATANSRNRARRVGERIRLALRCNPKNEGELLLLHVPCSQRSILGRESGGLVLLDQGNPLQQRRCEVAAQTYFGSPRLFFRSAHEVEGVLGLGALWPSV